MDAAIAQKMQQEMNDAMKSLQESNTRISTLVAQRTKIVTQLNENEMVEEELQLAQDDQSVYKLQGPVLIKVELNEARANVQSRLKFFKEEIARLDRQQKEVEESRKAANEKMAAINDRFRKLQQESVQRSVKA